MQDLEEAPAPAREHWGRGPSLTPAQVRECRKMMDSGIVMQAVADHFGVSRTAIYRGFDREHIAYRDLTAELAKYRAAVTLAKQALDQLAAL